MIRASTIVKQKLVLCKFHQLLRSGKDYSTNYMYQEAGKKAFMAPKRAGDLVRRHYKEVITDEMCEYLHENKCYTRSKLVDMFSNRFNLCEREGRLIIRYIWRKK